MSNNEEQQFSIQPHPQTDHNNAGEQQGPASTLQAAVSGNPGPSVLDNKLTENLEAPKSE